MNIIAEKEILGEYADQGFSLEECDGHIELYLKDSKIIKSIPKDETIGIKIREACAQFLKQDQEINRLLYKAGAECGLCDVEHNKLSKLIEEQERGQ